MEINRYLFYVVSETACKCGSSRKSDIFSRYQTGRKEVKCCAECFLSFSDPVVEKLIYRQVIVQKKD